jgi:hypothetical protein
MTTPEYFLGIFLIVLRNLESELLADENNMELPSHERLFFLENQQFRDEATAHTNFLHTRAFERQDVLIKTRERSIQGWGDFLPAALRTPAHSSMVEPVV